ncbi:MAG: baseplate J/gp47 family protein [Moorellaceae bacterium]
MIVTYVVKDNDTLEAIAAQFGVNWQDIVTYNHLHFPYIAPNPQDYQVAASGSVVFTLPFAESVPVVIPQGTLVAAPGINTQLTRYYKTTQAVTINPGSLSATVTVQCTQTGPVGNIGANRITQIVGNNPYNLAVTNPQPFTNGKSLNIATTGTVLYIPLRADMTAPSQPIIDFYAEFCKTDICLGPDGEFQVGNDGDLLVVSGLDNLAQDLKLRLETDKRDYIPNPNYGSNLLAIATSGEPYREKLLELEVTEVLKQDPRIKDVVNVQVSIVYPVARITADVTLVSEPERVHRLSLPLPLKERAAIGS